MDPRLERLLDLLDGSAEITVGTSVCLPGNLREAAVLAAELGLAASTTELTVRGLRDALEAFAHRAVLDAHYRSHPDAMPFSPATPTTYNESRSISAPVRPS